MAGELGELVPVRGIVASPTAVDRFWSKVDKQAEGGCWVWTGATTHNGYGIFNLSGGRTVRTHRWMLAQHLGRDLTKGELACHHCDNPPCVNPGHLFVSTPKGNTADMVSKGRVNRGEGRWSAKLTEEKVIAIREAIASGRSMAATAREAGVTVSLIHGIVHGHRWKHVGGPIINNENRSH